MTTVTKAAVVRPLRSLEDPGTLRTLVRNLKEGIYITNDRGEILDANPAMLNMCGVTSLDELRRLSVAQLLVEPAQRAREIELLKRDGLVRDFELEIRRPDGQLRTVIDTAHACNDAVSGEVLFHGILVDITARKRLELQLIEQSIRDPLTGCFNRRYMAEFERNLGRRSWGCVVLDIDHFKDYNDRHGHKAGDHALVGLSRFLMRHVRAEEGVVRMGGDEFVVLLAGADASTTEATAKRIQVAGRKQAPVPFSMGWSTRRGKERMEKTIARADRNLLRVRVLSRAPHRERRAR